MKKVWEVVVGHSWSKRTVEASDFKIAGDKALKLAMADEGGLPKDHKFISSVILSAEVEA